MKARASAVIMKERQEEIKRQILAGQDRLNQGCNAIVMLTLHDQFGFDEAMLRDFWKKSYEEYRYLVDRYEMEGDAIIWMLINRLKDECGIDVENTPWEDKPVE